MVEKINEVIHDLVLDSFSNLKESDIVVSPDSSSPWEKISSLGTELWLDTGDIGEASQLWNDEFSALTTNNTLLNREVQKGIYDQLVAETATKIMEKVPGIDRKRLILEIAFVLNAVHALRLSYIFNARVSVELHTDLAFNLDNTYHYGKRFFKINPTKFIIKVPFTAAGVIAARRLSDEGIPVNFTLGFSARQNYLIASLAKPAYVNVFMGRLNAFISNNGLGDGNDVGEKATLATQRELLDLRKFNKTSSRLIGASMRSGPQVADLCGLDTYTMPTKVASQYINNPSANPVNRVTHDPEVVLNEGLDAGVIYMDSLWQVPGAFKGLVEKLSGQDIASFSTGDLLKALKEGGFADFLPVWSDEEIEQIKKDGKIPSYQEWKEKLANKSIGLDALMNISALYSFIKDQGALDDRIRSIINDKL